MTQQWLDTSLRLGAKPDQYLLQYHVESGHTAIVKLLLKSGIDVNFKVNDKARVFYMWVNGYSLLRLALEQGQDEIAKLLLGAGAKADVSLFERPVKNGNIELVKLLIKATGNLNAKFTDSTALLHWVVKDGKVEMVKLLISSGADINAKGFEHQTPLYVAMKEDKTAVEDFLLANGGTIKGVDNNAMKTLLAHAVRAIR